ncbi:arginine--tRNA ligase [Gracilibacillus alcaliphilus]|uniref:arginine--tRNA ligase n=1 Tax=Gracilibacillus alcaliphilus TaxID=1401441 RepID=UPI00195D974B|nr:arginine--tRNA ligase [Gracilibacillus alcaliphilus]MBM7677886.1 arginyl-tRNA synthetase [Gracilibacillus alcaliphilus]
MDYKTLFVNSLHQQLGEHVNKEELEKMIEKPKRESMGDLAFPCFELAKIYRRSPKDIAHELAQKIDTPPLFAEVEAVSGYVNVFLDKNQVASDVIHDILVKKEQYGNTNIGQNQVITIDFSSPNIAKPFSMGHLRSTVIGNALALLAEKCGYQPVRINHIGDWGTQFGKLIVAYKTWGAADKVSQNPIKELLELYVRFHQEAESAPELNNQAKQWFKKLEGGDQEALSLWKWFRDESLKEFAKVYQLLDISFDSYDGEAFYNDKIDNVYKTLEEKQLLEESDGAMVVKVNNDLPPCLIKKNDGTSLYATRDLAAAIYRQERYQFTKSLYVVGNEQTLHFKQLFMVLEAMGYTWHQGLQHVPFGMLLQDGKKMSTRKGKIILLEQVLEQAIELAKNNILKKNPSLVEKDKVAHEVGIGAVIFHDLKNFRLHDIEFSLTDMLRFEGETGPYLQYTHARASSILKKCHYQPDENAAIHEIDAQAWSIIIYLLSFPDTIKYAFEGNDPSQLAKYLLELAKVFNKYYAVVRISDEDQKRPTRLALVYSVQVVLKEGLRLLGIKAPAAM